MRRLYWILIIAIVAGSLFLTYMSARTQWCQEAPCVSAGEGDYVWLKVDGAEYPATGNLEINLLADGTRKVTVSRLVSFEDLTAVETAIWQSAYFYVDSALVVGCNFNTRLTRTQLEEIIAKWSYDEVVALDATDQSFQICQSLP